MTSDPPPHPPTPPCPPGGLPKTNLLRRGATHFKFVWGFLGWFCFCTKHSRGGKKGTRIPSFKLLWLLFFLFDIFLLFCTWGVLWIWFQVVWSWFSFSCFFFFFWWNLNNLQTVAMSIAICLALHPPPLHAVVVSRLQGYHTLAWNGLPVAIGLCACPVSYRCRCRLLSRSRPPSLCCSGPLVTNPCPWLLINRCAFRENRPCLHSSALAALVVSSFWDAF